MEKFVCPADHKHAATGSCWTHHKCRCDPCSERESVRTKAAYRAERVVSGKSRLISSHGATRRLQALACMGWTNKQISELTGIDIVHLGETRRGCRPSIQLTTHKRIEAAYRRVAMIKNTGRSATYAAAHARRRGWAPPAAWDRIDDPREKPKGLVARDKELTVPARSCPLDGSQTYLLSCAPRH